MSVVTSRAETVVLLRGLPHGFEEPELTKFFGQFGTLNSAVISRSKRSGNPSGSGYLSFSDVRTANTVASHFKNYPLGRSIIKAELMDMGKVKSWMLRQRKNTVKKRVAQEKKELIVTSNMSVPLGFVSQIPQSLANKRSERETYLNRMAKEFGIEYTVPRIECTTVVSEELRKAWSESAAPELSEDAILMDTGLPITEN